jgi:hypothetical protein
MKLETSDEFTMCGTLENAEHLIDYCKKFNHIRNRTEYTELKEKKIKNNIERRNIRRGLKCLLKFIKTCEIKI